MTTSDAINIYNYSSPRQFLLDSLSHLQKLNPRFSVRSWAKRMGQPSHALLVMLLQGRRALRVNHVSFLAKGLPLTSVEQLYLRALIQYDSAETIEEKELCRLWLAELHPGKTFQSMEVEQFLAISHWVHMALLAMTELKGSGLTEDKAIQMLANNSNASEIRAAIDRLKNLGLLVVQPDGTLKAKVDAVTTKNDFANQGGRQYHKNVMALASEAIEKVPFEKREYQACALAIAKDQLPMAKDLIRKFRAQFAIAVRSKPGDEVYQLNIQFFQLTESPPAKPIAAEDEGAEPELYERTEYVVEQK